MLSCEPLGNGRDFLRIFGVIQPEVGLILEASVIEVVQESPDPGACFASRRKTGVVKGFNEMFWWVFPVVPLFVTLERLCHCVRLWCLGGVQQLKGEGTEYYIIDACE